MFSWTVATLALLVGFAGVATAGDATIGEVKSTSDKQIVLVNDHGKEQLFTLADAAHVDGTTGKLNSFKAGDKVVVIYATVKGGLYALDVRSAPKKVGDTMKGQFKMLRGTNQFILTHDGKDMLFTLTDHYYINTGSKPSTLTTLKSGTDVNVCYIKVNDGLYATSVITEGAKPDTKSESPK